MGTPLWDDGVPDLYAVLGVSPGADDAAITAAWHRQARATHPDTGGDPAQFRAVNVAFLVLSDPQERRRYDLTRIAPGPEPVPRRDTPAPRWHPVLWVLLGVAALVGSALWPWVTVITGVVVGVVVTTRYVVLARRHPGFF
ncbi:MAG: J domain-containing protein [Candidatus Nanopelagicales bacterium]